MTGGGRGPAGWRTWTASGTVVQVVVRIIHFELSWHPEPDQTETAPPTRAR